MTANSIFMISLLWVPRSLPSISQPLYLHLGIASPGIVLFQTKRGNPWSLDASLRNVGMLAFTTLIPEPVCLLLKHKTDFHFV